MNVWNWVLNKCDVNTFEIINLMYNVRNKLNIRFYLFGVKSVKKCTFSIDFYAPIFIYFINDWVLILYKI